MLPLIHVVMGAESSVLGPNESESDISDRKLINTKKPKVRHAREKVQDRHHLHGDLRSTRRIERTVAAHHMRYDRLRSGEPWS
jgi:hypothetical protein